MMMNLRFRDSSLVKINTAAFDASFSWDLLLSSFSPGARIFHLNLISHLCANLEYWLLHELFPSNMQRLK